MFIVILLLLLLNQMIVVIAVLLLLLLFQTLAPSFNRVHMTLNLNAGTINLSNDDNYGGAHLYEPPSRRRVEI